MKRKEILHNQRDEILRIAARYGARNLRIFGSTARGQDDAQSDIDILVDLEPGRSLFDLGGLLMDLEELRLLMITDVKLSPTVVDRLKSKLPQLTVTDFTPV